MQPQTQERIASLIQAGQQRQALAVLEEELRMAPNDWHANYLAGVALRFMGAFDRAITYLTKAAKLKPDDSSVYLALGIAHQLSGQLDQSIHALKQAIKADQNFIEAYNSLGLTYRKMGHFKEALDWYEKGTERLTELIFSEVHKDSSKCYRDEVIDGKATRTILPYVFAKTRELLRSNPLYAILRNNTGVCLTEIGDIENARKLFEEAIEHTPDGYDYPDPVQHLRNLEQT